MCWLRCRDLIRMWMWFKGYVSAAISAMHVSSVHMCRAGDRPRKWCVLSVCCLPELYLVSFTFLTKSQASLSLLCVSNTLSNRDYERNRVISASKHLNIEPTSSAWPTQGVNTRAYSNCIILKTVYINIQSLTAGSIPCARKGKYATDSLVVTFSLGRRMLTSEVVKLAQKNAVGIRRGKVKKRCWALSSQRKCSFWLSKRTTA